MAEEQKIIGEITEEDVEALRRLTAYMLPDSPAAAGLPAAVVRKYFYQWLTDNKQSIVALINRIVGDVNGELVPLGEDTRQLKSDVDSLKGRKLDKITEKNGTPVKQAAYVMGDNGEPTLLPYTRKSDNYTLVRRDNQGNAHVKKPTAPHDEHIVNVEMMKEQVDALEKQIKNAIFEIPDAEVGKRGMMTSQHVTRLTLLYNILNENTDGQINKIKEVLSAFEGFDEEFVLLEALNKKLDKNTESGSARVYGVDKTGAQAMYKHSSAADKYTLISRDDKGRAKVGAPVEDAHIANKAYVDSVSGAKVVDLTDNLHTSTFRGYEYYIVTAICGTYGETHCASWIITNKLLEMVPEGQTVRFAPYEFTSTDSNGTALLHVLSLEVYIDDPTQMSFSVNCECSGMTTDDLFNVYVEGVK